MTGVDRQREHVFEPVQDVAASRQPLRKRWIGERRHFRPRAGSDAEILRLEIGERFVAGNLAEAGADDLGDRRHRSAADSDAASELLAECARHRPAPDDAICDVCRERSLSLVDAARERQVREHQAILARQDR